MMLLAPWVLFAQLMQPPLLHLFYDNEGAFITVCKPEPPEAGPPLDNVWKQLQEEEHKKAKLPRPRFCAVEEPTPYLLPSGVSGVIFGYYNPKRNEILITLMDDDKVTSCIIIHEMLHALFGAGHKQPKWGKRMAIAGCGE